MREGIQPSCHFAVLVAGRVHIYIAADGIDAGFIAAYRSPERRHYTGAFAINQGLIAGIEPSLTAKRHYFTASQYFLLILAN